jgi:hypothetical protein
MTHILLGNVILLFCKLEEMHVDGIENSPRPIPSHAFIRVQSVQNASTTKMPGRSVSVVCDNIVCGFIG